MSTSSNVPSVDADLWDRPIDGEGRGNPSARRTSAPASAIPDDWDDVASSDEEDSRKVWETANNTVPMPQVVVASTTAGSAQSVVPPTSAFQAPIRILKRSPAPAQGAVNATSMASTGSETFAERSARYNAARERIFAGAAESTQGLTRAAGPASSIVRNPKGPEPIRGANGQSEGVSRGFAARTGKRGPSARNKEVSGRDANGAGV
ncbi:hypothetical protein BC834DRAFT_968804 [Gloeopeniophorella convolvens]|nr:hypothetical protein BC834DRAFT_968804 [Gloeopeniophorella convolvens]